MKRIIRPWWALISAAAVAWGCSGEPEGENQGEVNQSEEGLPLPEDDCLYGPETMGTALGSWQVFVDGEEGRWWVRDAQGRAVIESPGSCPGSEAGPLVRLGEGEPQSEFAFGAFRIALEGRRVPMEWEAFGKEDLEVIREEESILLNWGEGEEALGLLFSLFGEGDLSLRVLGGSGDRAGEVNWRCRPGEAFFGLGTQVTGMDLRGRTYPLWTQEQGNGKNDDPRWPLEGPLEAAYAPMGIWHSSEGYAALVGHDGYHELDLCGSGEDLVRLRSYPDLPEVVLVRGETAKERMTALTEYTGRLDVAPDWVFGPWNDAVSGPERLFEVAESLRENQIPSSAIWAEDWIGGEITATGFRLSYRWEWDRETYPDLPADIEELQHRGFAFLAYFNPFVPTTVPRYPEAVEKGYLIKDEEGEVYLFPDPAFRNASLVDLSTEEVREWTKGFMVRAIEELKIDGWMADFAEWLPVDATLGSGESPWRFHNLYPTVWQEVNRAAFEEVRGKENWTFFARSGWASARGGTPGISPTLWGGDQDTNWNYGDGLPSIVPIGAHVGMAGMAIYGSDIGGYSSLSSPNTDKELFLRWAAIGAFHPLMRTHHGGDKCKNWFYDSDEETLAAYRRLAQLHTLLLPYFRVLREDARERGWPMSRHPYLVEGADRRLWEGEQYQYFLGDDLLVAPILKQGEEERPVVLPEGRWWTLTGKESWEGGREITVRAAIGDIPVFARGGTLIPLLGFPVDSFYGAGDENVTDLSDVESFYRVALFPDGEGNAEGGVGTAMVRGRGLGEVPDWSSARLDGESLPECGEEVSPCADEDGVVVELVGGRIEVGGATVEIEGTEVQRYRVGVAGQAFGEWAEVPEITDLDPPFESYCDRLGL